MKKLKCHFQICKIFQSTVSVLKWLQSRENKSRKREVKKKKKVGQSKSYLFQKVFLKGSIFIPNQEKHNNSKKK